MALPNNIIGLDYSFGGVPFVSWSAPSVGTLGLDYSYGGVPFVAQPSAFLIDAAVIDVAPGLVRLFAVERTFPNPREENPRETQVKQINPRHGVQYPEYLP